MTRYPWSAAQLREMDAKDREAIARLRRRMPTDAAVMALCDDVEKKIDAEMGFLGLVVNMAPMGA